MHIVGFNCFAHDSAAVIMRDGEIVGFVEEERFLRKKHVGVFPVNSIRWCCKEAGIEPKDLEHIVYYWDPQIGIGKYIKHCLRYFPRSIELIRSRENKFFPMFFIRDTLRKEFGITSKTKLHFAEHHMLHGAGVFLPSPFEKAAILSVDAAGEWCTTWFGYGEGLDLYCLKRINFPHSLGIVYGAVTEHLGYLFSSGEGKVMGLASYGDPNRYIDEFRKMIICTKDGGFKVDLSYFTYHYKGRPKWFSKKFIKIFGPGRPKEAEVTQQHMDIAAGLQLRTEEVCFHLADWLYEKTKLPAVCLAGGVCLNSVMNGKLLARGLFKDVWVLPAAYDPGASIGGCFWLWNTKFRNPRKYIMRHAYFGPHFSNEDIAVVLKKRGLNGIKVKNAPRLAAELLAKGKIVGWFRGSIECGPRALGNRSILTAPYPAEMKDILNARVKFREWYRPFAPSVPEERCGEFFEIDYPSPYMILVYNVRPEMKDKIPAVTHVDGTGRVQTVTRDTNPAFYDLIQEFGKLTGVYCVLNTSYNIRGEPIVNIPDEAIDCYLKTGMDALFLEDYMLTKEVESAALIMSDEQIQEARKKAALMEEGQ
jgi:carbamoyltransferase